MQQRVASLIARVDAHACLEYLQHALCVPDVHRVEQDSQIAAPIRRTPLRRARSHIQPILGALGPLRERCADPILENVEGALLLVRHCQRCSFDGGLRHIVRWERCGSDDPPPAPAHTCFEVVPVILAPLQLADDQRLQPVPSLLHVWSTARVPGAVHQAQVGLVEASCLQNLRHHFTRLPRNVQVFFHTVQEDGRVVIG
mmetsp:Transcript_32448/g.70871  ORF Transcript_32448/g.70871 Transcript_32448/m.70871 type:complete len:200 (-) Transcript_32448:863-1462(-)